MECGVFQPLVSVAVITYNSSKTVVETLDSIFNQTYQNLELIVSDDCSTDNTVDICQEWINAHKERFFRMELLTVGANTGISANMNRAERACQGEWVKPIAGDDVLFESCIGTCVSYILEHPETVYLFAKLSPFRENKGEKCNVDISINYDFFLWPIDEQYHYLVFKHNLVPAPTAFYNRVQVNNLGITNDERIPMMEDWPKWLNLLKKRVRFQFISKELVKYRLSEKSVSNSEQKCLAFRKSLALFYLYYQHNDIWKEDKARAIASYVFSKSLLSPRFYWEILNNIIVGILKLKKILGL